jgi:hypothetical protein
MSRSYRGPLLAITMACGVLTFSARPAAAEEGGSGHYFPGSMASFIDGVSPSPAFLVHYNQIYYSGSVGANKAIPIAGSTALGLHATSWGEGATVFWRPDGHGAIPSKRWSYAMSMTIPFMQMDVSADAVVQLPPAAGGTPAIIAREGSLGAIGDIVVIPLMLNYNFSPNTNVNFRLTEYLPTGDYAVGRLANTGKNYYTTEPTLAVIYLGTKNGREASLFAAMDFNSQNSATQYTTGDQFHLDGTLAQHLPLMKGLAGIGVSSFYYTQFTGDSGSGATLGKFEGKTAGVGPAISYIKPFGHKQLMAELKWLNEYYTQNRLQGNTVFLKVAFKF